MSDLRDLLDRAAPPLAPPPGGLDRAVRRARSMRRRTVLAGLAVVPVAALALFATLTAVQRSSDVRTVPADGDGTSTATTLPSGSAPATVAATGRAGDAAPRRQPAPPPQAAGSPASPYGGQSGPRPPRVAFRDSTGIWTVQLDGSDRRKVYPYARTPLGWSPDGRTLLVHVPGAGSGRIDILDIDTGVHRPLLESSDFTFHDADFSPDGRRLAYSATEINRSGKETWSHVYVSDADGRNARRLPYRGRSAVWSPDGTRIAFDCDHDEQQGVSGGWNCIMAPDGTGLRELANTSTPMAWSPDGQWLAAMAYNGTGIDVVRPDGSERRTIGLASKWVRPAWTPDSRRVIYSRSVQTPKYGVCPPTTACEPPGIYSSAIDGSGHVRLTTSDWDMYPVTPSR